MDKAVERELNPELGKALFDLGRLFEEQDRITRQRQIRRWKKLDYFWHNLQYFLEDDQWGIVSPELNPDEFDDVTYYTKVYNIFKAHGESIIAALSVDFPGVIFPPDDAENPDDLDASKAINDIAELIRKHSRTDLECIKALFTLYYGGVVFGRTYSEENKKYGTIQIPQYEDSKETVCPDCNVVMNGSCPQCGNTVGIEETIPIISGYAEEFKRRQKIALYGPLNVYVPSQTIDKDKIFYLRLALDINVVEANHNWNKGKKNEERIKFQAHDDPDQWEQWGRRSFEGFNSNQGTCVERYHWFTPTAYCGLSDEMRDYCYENFPDGVRAVFVNDILVELESEDLHEVWEISSDPRSRHIHADPIGLPLVDVQEVTNEVFNLTVQSVEQNIPQTFVDSEVLDLDKYKESEARPGVIYPVKSRPGKSLNESFTTLSTASLGREIKEFTDRLDRMGQFVVGSFPSLWGGQMVGSRTAAEYSMSRQQALQRLSTTWKIVCYFWAGFLDKACKQYAKNMQTDEHFVRREKNNSYVNVWIRKSQLAGKIGDVEPEVVDHFPISSSQKRDFFVQLIEFNNPAINEFIFHPNNRSEIARIGGMKDLYIPGEHDQTKQIAEIDLLLKSGPSQVPDELNPMQVKSTPSVPTDPQVDDAGVHIQACKAFLNSERGRLIRTENPEGWQNVLSHLMQHQDDLMGQMMLQNEAAAPGMPPKTAVENTGA